MLRRIHKQTSPPWKQHSEPLLEITAYMYDSKNIILGYACTWVCPLPLARQESLIMQGFPISSLDIITIKNKKRTEWNSEIRHSKNTSQNSTGQLSVHPCMSFHQSYNLLNNICTPFAWGGGGGYNFSNRTIPGLYFSDRTIPMHFALLSFLKLCKTV